MRLTLFGPIFIFSILVSLTGCGGGGAAGGSLPLGGKVGGVVEQVDDATSGLAGVQLEMLETGEVVTTTGSGAFQFTNASPSSFTLMLAGPPTGFQKMVATNDAASSEADEGDIEDGDESTEDRVVIHRVQDGERLHVRLRIRDGLFEQVEVSRSEHDEREVEIQMDRAASSDDLDIEGKLELEVRDDRSGIEVEVEHAAPDRDLELVAIAPDGTEESLGILTVGLDGETEWEVETSDGGILPFGVDSVEALEGYEVEVRDATDGTALLRATLPEVPLSVPDAPSDDADDDDGHDDDDSDDDDSDDDDDGGDSDDDGESRLRGRSPLVAVVAGLKGHIEIRSREQGTNERLEIEGEHLSPDAAVEFFVEDGLGADTFTSIGARSADMEGEAELELETGDGDALPNGAATVAELVGLKVEVRDAATGDLLLSGTIPALASDR